MHIRANERAMLLSGVSFEFTLYLNYVKNPIYKIRSLFFLLKREFVNINFFNSPIAFFADSRK